MIPVSDNSTEQRGGSLRDAMEQFASWTPRSRIWTVLRWLLGIPARPVRPVTRMTSDQVAAIAAASMTAARLPFGAMPPQLGRTEGQMLYPVVSSTIGSGWRVKIDDATGIAGPVTWWDVH